MHQQKQNRVIDPQVFHMNPLEVSGWLVLNDNWITEHCKSIFCIETNKQHRIIEFLDKPLYHLVPENQRHDVRVIAFNPKLSNWRDGRFTRLKVEDQEQIKFGYRLTEVRDLW